MGQRGGKYLTKMIFDIKIETTIFKISNVPNFNKFRVLLILGPIWAEQVVNVSQKLSFTPKSRSGYSKYEMCQISINPEPF